MARRKKALAEFHRDQIAGAARLLFEQNGIGRTTVDEIAKTAEYSKATLYVYFKNKEEIVEYLVLESMQELYGRMERAIGLDGDLISGYGLICRELAAYRREQPVCFDLILNKIRIVRTEEEGPEIPALIYQTGEEINRLIGGFLEEGIRQGVFREDLRIPQTVFLLWSSLAGMIRMADEKREYIESSMGCSSEEFMEYGFDCLLRSIKKEGR